MHHASMSRFGPPAGRGLSLLLLLAGLSTAPALLPAAQAAGVPVSRAVRRELVHDEGVLRRAAAGLPDGEGAAVQIVRESDRLILRVPARLLFAPDAQTLRSGAQTATLLALPTQLLRKRRRLQATVAVYTDNIGGTSFNQALSQQRAEAVKDALQARGVPARRLQAEGVGLSDALASNDTPEGRIQNRRVEFVFERAGPVGRAAHAPPAPASGGRGQ